MSLETKIETLTQAIIALTDKIEFMKSSVTTAVEIAPVVAPIVEAPAPLVQPVVAQVSVTPQNLAPLQPVAPVMPAPPAFVAPAPVTAPVISNAPFTDGKGLIEYVMNSYKALGPQKGAQIQNVLTGLGYQNINDIKPEHYGQLYAGVEALK